MTLDTMRMGLTPDEQHLLDQIELNASTQHDHQRWRRNGELVVELTNRLADRDAIPAHRLLYFTDPEYNVGGRGRSRMGVFEHNGCQGEDILRHPHFLKFLRYFLEGPDLPTSIIVQFATEVEACDPVTSGDIIPLAKLARDLIRRSGLDPNPASEEFFKLALEAGLDASDAESMRQSVRQIRRR